MEIKKRKKHKPTDDQRISLLNNPNRSKKAFDEALNKLPNEFREKAREQALYGIAYDDSVSAHEIDDNWFRQRAIG